MKSMTRNLITVVGIALGLLLPMQAESAESGALKNLTAEWWQWALSIPTSENPTLDPTGDKCFVGQRGSTWFLAGSYGGGPVTRTCPVPAGKEIFFPIANASFFDSPNVCGQGPEHLSAAEMRAFIADFIAGLTDVSVELDAEPVDLHRVRSRIFEVALPEENLFDAPCASEGGFPAGIYSPAVDDGYYVQLEPLAAGEHTLHFHAEHPEAGFVIDTTYNLTVVPVSRR
jgi:hypothetical protein